LASGRLRRVFLRTLGRHHFLRTHHPVRRLAGSITTIVACASASYARDRPAASNQSPHAKNYERDPLSFSHDRPDRRGPRYPHMCAATSTSAGFLGQAPLLRFSSPATLTGCARAVRGGRPPDDPASAFPIIRRPARLLFKATCRRDGLSRSRPCGFPLERIRCDEARVADAFPSVRSVPIESVARAARVSPMGPVSTSVSAGRRSVALTSRVFDRTRR